MLLEIWNYNNFDNFLVSRLYKVRRVVDNEETVSQMEHNHFSNINEWFLDSLPKCMRCKKCCRKSVKLKELELARLKLSREINIIEIVKSRRLIKQAIM